MDREISRDTPIPVLGLGYDQPGDIRRAALALLVNQSYGKKTWRIAEAPILDLLDKRSDATDRISLLELAVRVPLLSVRERVRRIALDPADPDASVAREFLAQVGENRFANILINDFIHEAATEHVARSLAKSPLERMQLSTPELEARLASLDLEDPEQSSAYFWGAIALGKVGYFKHLDKVMRNLDLGWLPGILFGNPFFVCDEIRAAAFDSSYLLDYAEKQLRRLDPDDPDNTNNATLKVIDALLARPRDERVVQRTKSTMEPGDVAARLHEIEPSISSEQLSVVIGNDLVQLMSQLPAFEADGPGILRAYRKLVDSIGRRSPDFESQLGWILAQGDLLKILSDCRDLLASDDELERTIAWSIASKGSVFAPGQAPPVFGDGSSGVPGKPLWADVALLALSEGGFDALESHSDSHSGSHPESQKVSSAPPPMDSMDGAESVSSPAPTPEPASGSEFEETPGGDPPRSAYALLDCPDEVEPMVEFEVVVGLSENPTPGVLGTAMQRPDWSVGSYKVKIALLYDGFMLRSGEVSEVTLDVTADKPYPKKCLHLTAVASDRFKESRTLLAQYSIDGQFIGSAARPIVVKKEGATQASTQPTGRGFDLSMPPGVPTPDMTISITRGNTVGHDRLVWSVMTPHSDVGITLSDSKNDYLSDIGVAPEQWARNLMNAINANPSTRPLGPMMIGNGREIQRQIPVGVRRQLHALSQRFPDPEAQRPTLFIVSDEPHIPWELAYIELDLPGRKEDFLGAKFVVGRWLHGYERVDGNRVPVYPPPTEIRVRSMAVVSGDYSNTRNWNPLEGANQEAEHLKTTYHASPVAADAKLAEWLVNHADVEVIHFAVHGKWGLGGGQDGIVLVDGSYLTRREVSGARLKKRPLVFLNACQLGQGEQVLGDYGGIAAAFLEAGASGVIAALWNVDDNDAKDLALDFYRQAESGQARPGEVFRRQRSQFENNTKSKLSLAYQFFGHPQMRMTLELP